MGWGSASAPPDPKPHRRLVASIDILDPVPLQVVQPLDANPNHVRPATNKAVQVRGLARKENGESAQQRQKPEYLPMPDRESLGRHGCDSIPLHILNTADEFIGDHRR